MELKRDGNHSSGCTAIVAHREGRLRSPWSAAHWIESSSEDEGGARWCVVPCADPRCAATRRLLVDIDRRRPAVVRAYAA